MSKKVADQLVEMLVDAGVERVYAVTGDSLNEVNDAIRRNGNIEWVHVRHEETGAYAAGAEAQITGKLACCAGSSGPGHVHLINGLYDAHRSGAPVIAIASTVESQEFGSKYFQETDTMHLFTDCSYYNQVATTAVQMPRMLQAAMQYAVSSKGVSVLGLPGDLAGSKSSDTISALKTFPSQSTVCPSDDDVTLLAKLLNEQPKITIFCGIGAKDAHDEVVELSKLLKAPVAYTFKSKMEIQYDNPHEVGMNGLLGMSSGYYSMHHADVLLMLGTDFPYSAFLPDDNIIVQVDIKPDRIGRRCKVDMGIWGDVKSTLKALLPFIKQKTDDKFLTHHLAIHKKVMHGFQNYIKSNGHKNSIHPEYVMDCIDQLAADDAVFTVDTGMTCVWGARYLNATGRRKLLGSFNHGSMANALAQSIGAQLSCPGRQVLALCGDGGLSMLTGDLATIVQYKLPVKIIVFNNRALGMVKLEMQVMGLSFWQTDMLNPDFEMLAKAFGINGYTVRTPDEVMPTLKTVMESDGAALVNIMTDPDALAMPPKVKFDQMLGFAESMYKLMINGRSKEIIEVIKSNYKHISEVI